MPHPEVIDAEIIEETIERPAPVVVAAPVAFERDGVDRDVELLSALVGGFSKRTRRVLAALARYSGEEHRPILPR